MTTDLMPFATALRPAPAEIDRDEPLSRRDHARLLRHRERNELQNVLGTIFLNTTMLPIGTSSLAPARDEYGRVLRWTLWAPQRRVLIDVMPRTAEIEMRQAFADAHNLRYAIVEAGRRLTAKSVKEWL